MNSTEILIKVRKIVRAINLESKKIQKEYGVSIPQVLCLNYLKESENYQSTQGEIKKFLNLNSSTISGIINRLESKGLLARLPKSGDKRMVNIALTTKGDKILENIPPLLHEQLSRNLEYLDVNMIRQVEGALDKVIELLDIVEIEASPVLTSEESLDENPAEE
jgi:DNA-binding MarR family transcriptional regulator